MKLPSTAVIAPEKIRRYLLSPRKRNDKSKWLAKAGYKLEDWRKLEKDLRTQILTLDALSTEGTKYGQMYESDRTKRQNLICPLRLDGRTRVKIDQIYNDVSR